MAGIMTTAELDCRNLAWLLGVSVTRLDNRWWVRRQAFDTIHALRDHLVALADKLHERRENVCLTA